MDDLIRIKKRGQLTIPAVIMKMFQLKPDDYLLMQVKEDRIELIPQAVIPKSQEYFWTKKWQEAEKSADEDIKEGRMSSVFVTPDEFLTALSDDNEI